MKEETDVTPKDTPGASGIPPITLEGFSVLHQMFRFRREALTKIDHGRRLELAEEAAAVLRGMESRENGASAAFTQLGHKGDLLFIHFRQSFDELARAESELAALELFNFLEPATSYLSMVEIGLYEATVRMRQKLQAAGIAPDSAEWKKAFDAAIADNREKLAARLYPAIPGRRYLCFYPMNKRRGEIHNWYQLPLEQRRRLMHDHGMIGRRFAGQVTQIISGSVGFDDWEWGVDLFADDPIVFKRLVYEMRFDESSALYAEFGPFYVGMRLSPDELSGTIAGSDGRRV
ncbi:MAG: hydrogen peroxide-dependent heme synthase [Candidatus Binataceae bacterium]